MQNNYNKKFEIINLNRWIQITVFIVLCLFTDNVSAICNGTPSPAGIVSALPAAICGSGTTTLSLSGNDADVGITLQWQSSSISMVSGGVFANVTGGSGAATNSYTSGTINSTTYYSCLLTCIITGDTARSNEVVVTVYALPAPPIISVSPSPVCAPGTITFTSSYASGNVWSPGGSTANNIIASGVGSYTYTVTYTNIDGCSASSAPANGVINSNSVSINASNNGNLCSGGSVSLSSSNVIGNVWSTGLTTQNINVTTTGTYTVTNTNVNGCSATASFTVINANLPVVSISPSCTTLLTGNSSILTANATAGTGTIVSYQWVQNGAAFVGTNSTTFSTSTAGSYTVIVTNSAGCSVTSNAIVLENTSALNGAYTIGGTASCTNFNSMANAAADLNNRGVSGNVNFTFGAGYTETAPAGGIVFSYCSLSPSRKPSASHRVTFTGPAAINAPAGTSTALTTGDGIIKLVGADWFTFDQVNIADNNSTPTTQMEWGYALLKCDGNNGSNYNTIKNCTITLKKTNTLSNGIYSGNHNASGLLSPAFTGGASASLVVVDSSRNGHNVFIGNIISNVNNGINLNGNAATTGGTPPLSLNDTLNEAGQIGVGLGNSITNFGGNSVSANGVIEVNQHSMKVNNNIITIGTGSTNTVFGINMVSGTWGEIRNNTISLASSATTSGITGITCGFTGGDAANPNLVTITGNTISLAASWTTASNGTFSGIASTSGGTGSNSIISNNTIQNITFSGNGDFTGISCGSPANLTANGNTVTNISKSGSASAGTITCFTSGSITSTSSITNNTISNCSITLAAARVGTINGMTVISPSVGTWSGNLISSLSLLGTSTQSTSAIIGLQCSPSVSASTITITGNSVSGLSSTASISASIMGMQIVTGINITVSSNSICNISAGNTLGIARGIQFSGGAASSIYNVFNNRVGGLSAPNANPAAANGNAVMGIDIAAASALPTFNISHNTILLSGTGGGVNFGSSGIMANTAPTVSLRNNIIINTITSGASSHTAAYRRSSATLTSYASNSNNNIFYSGLPSSLQAIYFDGTNTDATLALYKTRVSARDNNSKTENVSFLSTACGNANFLKINGAGGTLVESGGLPISGITTDFEGDIRSAVTPDIGADEGNFFNASMIIASLTANPPAGQCTSVSHLVSAVVTPGSNSVASVALYYFFNGIPGSGSPLAMTPGGGNSWTGLIPAASPANALVTWSITALDAGSNTVSGTGASYTDNLSGISFTSSVTPSPICLGSSAALSSVISGPQTQPVGYCTSGVPTGSTTDEQIFGVTFGTMNNSPQNETCSSNYTDYTGTIPAPTINTGSSVAWSVYQSECDGPGYFSNGISIFIDYNRDGDFLDLGEQVYTTNGTLPGPRTLSGTINIPPNASIGVTRMRVVCAENVAAPAACEVFNFGEAEDYLVNIVGGNGFTFSWSDGTNTIASTQNASYIPTTVGSYTYTVTASDQNGCNLNSTNSVTVLALPAAPAANNSSQCGLGVPNCFVTGSGGTFRWYLTPSGGIALAGETGSSLTAYTISSTTTFYVSKFVGTCESPRSMVIQTVSAAPIVMASNTASNPICPFVNFDLAATGSGYTSLNWTALPVSGSGITGVTTGSPVSIHAALGGTYVYTVIASNGVCATSSTTSVTVIAPPIIVSTAAVPSTVCPGGNVTLTALTNQIGTGIATVGNGILSNTNSSFPAPYSSYYTGARLQMLITASELTAAGLYPGNITSLAFNVTALNGALPFRNFTIRMAATSLTSLTPTFVTTGFSTVYTNSLYTPVSGINTHLFNGVPFNWNGTSNIIVETTFLNCATCPAVACSTFTLNASTAYSTTTYVSSINAYADGNCSITTQPSGNTYSQRPNIILGGQTLNAGVGNLIWQWGPGVIPAGNTANVNPSNATANPINVNYTVQGTDPVSGCSNYSTVSVTVNPIPASLQSNNGSQCGYGVPTCSITGNGGSFRWYLTPTGGTPLPGETLNHLVSYFISSSQFFYVAEWNGSCESERVAVYENVLSPDAITAHSSTPTCLNSVINLTVTKAPGASNYNYTWTATPFAGSGLSGPTPGAANGNLNVTPTASGTYIYSVDAYDSNTLCSAHSTVTVTVSGHPVLDSVSVSATTICGGNPVTLNAYSAITQGGSQTPPGPYCTISNLGELCVTHIVMNTMNAVPPVCASPFYHINSPSGANTTTLVAGSTYTVTVSLASSAVFTTGGSVSIWFDWNRNGDFEPTEWYQPFISGLSGSMSITIPMNVVSGITGMRVRSRGAGNPNGELDGCIDFGSGSSEDYFVNILGIASQNLAYNYSWMPGGITGATVAAIPANSTGYTITVTNPLSGCSTTGTTSQITVLPSPTTPIASVPSTQCGFAVPSCSAAGGGGFMSWYLTPTGGIPIPGETGEQLFSYVISTTTTFYVAEFDGTCEGPRAMVIANVSQPDIITASTSTPVCSNAALQLNVTKTGSANNYTYSWTASPLAGSGLSGSTAGSPIDGHINVVPTGDGSFTYTVSGHDLSAGCLTLSTITVNITKLPVTDSIRVSPAVSCSGSPISLNIYSSGYYVGPQTAPTGYPGLADPGDNSDEQIYGVTFGSMVNNQIENCSTNYQDYTSTIPAPTVVTGSAVSFQVRENECDGEGFFENGFSIYIDYNRDGDWLDTNELAYTTTVMDSASNVGDLMRSGTIIIPSNASPGLTRMRVILVEGVVSPTSTEFFAYGEQEDYLINIESQLAVNPLLNYSWNPGGMTGASTTSNPALNTIYTVTLTEPNSGCSSTASINVNVSSLPSAPTASAPSLQCGLGVPACSVSGSGGTFNWFLTQSGGTPIPGEIGTALTAYTIAATTTFYVSKNNGTCESNRTPVIANVTNPSILTLTSSADSVCINTPLTITASLAGNPSTVNYLWSASPSLGSGLIGLATTSSVNVTPNIDGEYVYTCIATETTNNCVSTSSYTIFVNPPPDLPNPTANPQSVCPGSCSQLNAGTFYSGSGLLITPQNQNDGSSANFFDVLNTSPFPITLHYFSMQMSGTSGIGSVYYLPGGINCSTPLISSFVLAGTAAYTGLGGFPNPYTQIPMDMNITIPSGGAYGICVSSSGNQYTIGTDCNLVLASDANFEIYQGWGGTTSNAIADRNWNGSFTYSYASGNPGLIYSWTPASTLNLTTSMTPVACPASNTSYTVTTTDPETGCTSSGSVSLSLITASGGATAITANPISICNSGTINLSLINHTSGFSYQWQSSATGSSPWTNFGAGADTASAYITANKWFRVLTTCGTSVDSSNKVLVTVIKPSITSVNNGSHCGPGPVTLSVVGNGSFDWFASSSGGTALASNTSVYTTPTLIGTTNYWVQAYIGTCQDPSGRHQLTANITQGPAVTVIVNPGSTICNGTQITLTASSSNAGYTYKWSTDSINTILTNNTLVVTPTINTTYYLTAVDYTGGANSGCVSQVVTPVTVLANPPLATISPASSTICTTNGCAALSVAGAVVNTPVNVVIGTGSINNSTTGYPAPYGNFSTGDRNQNLILASELTAAGLAAGPINSVSLDVAAVNVPALGAYKNFKISIGSTTLSSMTNSFITGLTTVYSNSSYLPVTGWNTHAFNAGTFTWDGISNIVIETTFMQCTTCPATSCSNQALNCIMNQTATAFNSTIDAHADANCGITTSSAGTTYSIRPNMKIGGFTGSSNTYTWNPGNITGPSANVCPGTTTTYTVVTSQPSGCTSSATTTIFYDPVNPPMVPAQASFCPGGFVTLNAGPGYTHYTWANNSGIVSTSQIYVASPAASTVYTITVDRGGVCSATASVNVTKLIVYPPVITSTAGSYFCSGGSSSLNAGTYSGYLWSTSATTQSIVVNNSGTYMVTVTGANSCASTGSYTITVIQPPPNPTVTPAGPIDICLDGSGSPITLTADITGAGQGAMISWNDINSGSSNTLLVDNNSPDLILNGNTYYYGFTVTNSYGCQSSSNLVPVNLIACGVTFDMRMYIEGYYASSNTGLMDNYGAGGCLFLAGMSSDPTDADIIEISAMNAATLAVADVQEGILKIDGNVQVTFGPGVTSGTAYYIRVKHRNALQTWSANPILMSSLTMYDFSTSQSQAYGGNMVQTQDALHWAFYSGDISDAASAFAGIQDEVIESQDYSDMENAVFITLAGYMPEDITGDLVVESLDYSIIENNVFFVIYSIHP